MHKLGNQVIQLVASCFSSCVCIVQEPRLENDDASDDDAEDDDDDDGDAAVGGDRQVGDNGFDGPAPTKTRRQTFDGPVLPLDAEGTFALPGNVSLPLSEL